MKNLNDINWVAVRHCTDIDDYEVVVEQQKRRWQCDQQVESWVWRINYHGAITAQGTSSCCETAKELALANVPMNAAD